MPDVPSRQWAAINSMDFHVANGPETFDTYVPFRRNVASRLGGFPVPVEEFGSVLLKSKGSLVRSLAAIP